MFDVGLHSQIVLSDVFRKRRKRTKLCHTARRRRARDDANVTRSLGLPWEKSAPLNFSEQSRAFAVNGDDGLRVKRG